MNWKTSRRASPGPAVMYSANTVVSFVFGLGVMIWISPSLTLAALVPMTLLPPIVLWFGRTIHTRFERIQEQFAALSTMVQENLTGVRIVRAYAQEAAQAREFDGFNLEYLKRNMHLAYVSGAFHPIMGLLTGAAMVVVLWYGGHQVMTGTITTGDFVAFSFYLVLLGWPMIALGWVVNLFQRGAASMGRINRIFAIEPAIASPAVPHPPPPGAAAIEFRNVCFRYPGRGEEGEERGFDVRWSRFLDRSLRWIPRSNRRHRDGQEETTIHAGVQGAGGAGGASGARQRSGDRDAA